jgi:hypothetical protein
MKKISIFIIVFLLPYLSHSQTDTVNIKTKDTANTEVSFNPLVIPAALISYGIATRLFKPLQHYLIWLG